MRKSLIALAATAVLVAACGGSAATGGAPATGAPASGVPTNASQSSANPANSAIVSANPTSGPTGAGPAALDACTLLTAGEAAAALGEPVDPGTVPTPGARSCLWSTTKLSTNGVEISITDIKAFNPDKPSIPGLTITKVSGIGDAAYFVSLGAGFQSLNFRKGQTTLSVGVVLKSASDTDLLALEKTLALAALGRF